MTEVDWEQKYYDLLERHEKMTSEIYEVVLAQWKKINNKL